VIGGEQAHTIPGIHDVISAIADKAASSRTIIV